MNNWDQIRKMAIVEADDFQDHWDRNGLNFLFYWKAKFPKFKITLYTIPNRTSRRLLKVLEPAMHNGNGQEPWIELAVHGFDHESNFECWGWDYDKTNRLLDRIEKEVSDYWQTPYYKKNFKAPGWMITGGPNGEGSGYPLNPPNPLATDPQAVYRALTERGYMICDRYYNGKLRPANNDKIICIDCNPDIVHFHTWDMVTGDPNGRNGFKQVEEEKGVPWDENTEFYFMSEALEKGLYKPCSHK